MSTRKDEDFEAVVEPVCRAHGVECVQVSQLTVHGSAVLRVLIDRPGAGDQPGSGVTVADCQAVSRDLGPALDVHEVLRGSYRLEVSSPGLDRPLVKPRDYARFSGRKVRVSTRAPQPDGRGGERRKFQGQLLGIDGEMVRLEVEGSVLVLPIAAIAKANVVYEF
jgi:ribosome maturation factor RimP